MIRKINSTNHENNAWAMFERAAIDFAGFDAAFAAEAMALGYEIPGRDVIALLAGDFRPEMIEALRRIKTQIQNRMHHQQHAVRCVRRDRLRPLDLFARDHGTVRCA